MIFETFFKTEAYKRKWHVWYAWYPVLVKSEPGKQTWMWRERIWRRITWEDIGDRTIDYTSWCDYLPLTVAKENLPSN